MSQALTCQSRASGGSRTHNPRITNAVLCRLKLRWPREAALAGAPPPVDKRFSVGRWPNIVKPRWGLELRRVVRAPPSSPSSAFSTATTRKRTVLYSDTARRMRFSVCPAKKQKTGVSDGPNTFWRAGVARGKSTTTANSSETPRASRRVDTRQQSPASVSFLKHAARQIDTAYGLAREDRCNTFGSNTLW